MGVKCEIKFEQNPHGVFYAGQVMSGAVQISMDKARKFKGVYLKFNGYAKCNWTQTEYRSSPHPIHNRPNTHHHNRRIQESVRYSGHEKYLGTMRYIVGPSSGIRVIIDGAAKAHWVEKPNTLAQPRATVNGGAGPPQPHAHHRPARLKVVHYKATEIYLNTRSYLERGMDGNDVQLQSGVHTYAFQCFLPAALPTSFEGKHGSIRYTIKVVMERPWKFDISHKIGFTVLKVLDLNYDTPILRMPCQMEMAKSFCCWPCRTGPLSLTASVPQTGYVPGQSIIIQAQVINLSGNNVDCMKFELRQLIVYHSQTPTKATKEEQRSILQKRSAGCAQNNEERYEVNLPIPSLPSTNMNGCRIIFISYDIKVEAKVSGFSNNPFVEIPITIGNVPLQSVRHAYENVGFSTAPEDAAAQVPPRTYETPSAPIGSETPVAGVSQVGLARGLPHQSYTDLPPPSYEECLGDAKEPDEDGEAPFNPRYPVYHLDAKAQAPRLNENTSKN